MALSIGLREDLLLIGWWSGLIAQAIGPMLAVSLPLTGALALRLMVLRLSGGKHPAT